MRASTAILVLLAPLLLGYVFYAPTTDDMVDRWHYRLCTAGAKFGAMISTLRGFIQPDDDLYFRTINTLMEWPLPEADSQVPGSNIKARYTEFDGVRVLLYEPIGKRHSPVPGFVYFHGGGYTIGSTKTHASLTRRFAEELDAVLVSVEYRLAPAHPFPASFEDCLTAVKWLLNHASEYGVDAKRVIVGGDSVGGYLTALVVQNVHDDSTLPDIKLQVHFYPWLQIFDFNTPSYRKYEQNFGTTGVVSKPRMAEFTSAVVLGRLDAHFMEQMQRNAHTSAKFKQSRHYREVLDHKIVTEKLSIGSSSSDEGNVGSFEKGNDTLWDEIRETVLDPRLSPLFREDYKGLPSAFIATGDLDSLRDDGIFYAQLLEEAGVPVTWRNYEGVYHGIVAAGPITNIPTGVKIVKDAIEYIEKNI